jgi:hypothetical protein
MMGVVRTLQVSERTASGPGGGGAGGRHLFANHSSECIDCMTPTSAIPAFGAVVGAATGTLVGWLVYLARSSTPRRTEHGTGDVPRGSSLTCAASDEATGIRLCASGQ